MATKKPQQPPASAGEFVQVNPDIKRRVDGFSHEERIAFRFDSGWDLSVLHDRSVASVQRAVTRERMAELPPFSTDLELRVVVEIVERA